MKVVRVVANVFNAFFAQYAYPLGHLLAGDGGLGAPILGLQLKDQLVGIYLRQRALGE